MQQVMLKHKNMENKINNIKNDNDFVSKMQSAIKLKHHLKKEAMLEKVL